MPEGRLRIWSLLLLQDNYAGDAVVRPRRASLAAGFGLRLFRARTHAGHRELFWECPAQRGARCWRNIFEAVGGNRANCSHILSTRIVSASKRSMKLAVSLVLALSRNNSLSLLPTAFFPLLRSRACCLKVCLTSTEIRREVDFARLWTSGDQRFIPAPNSCHGIGNHPSEKVANAKFPRVVV